MMQSSPAIKSKSCAQEPVMLNGWKHHVGFVLDQLRKWSKKPEQAFPLFVAKLKMLGDSQFDMYTGEMAPDKIGHDLVNTLMGFRVYDRTSYFRWIDSSNQLFWQLPVSDGSEWTLRKGDNEDYYIHIHPSRHSKHTQRLKASHFRTALATLIMANMRGEKPGLQLMNNVRCDFLGMSAVAKPMAKEIFATLNAYAKMADIPH